uniref:Uncharacterized protein n=1 Tax=Vespula pensylvanica TaxID=30213 RepID=A0A834NS05_VESPE|nr:hypothetical protein H0235_011225 [Vespula pensylvanica]
MYLYNVRQARRKALALSSQRSFLPGVTGLYSAHLPRTASISKVKGYSPCACSPIRYGDTSLSTIAEVPSRYHFAAHMGQLISGVEGQGCHNFYPTCPLPSVSVLNMMKKVRLQ